MLAIILFVIVGLLFGYFSTQNTATVTLHLGAYTLTNIPLYLLVLSSFGIGILYATIYYFFKSFSFQFRFGKKEKQLADSRREIAELTKELHKLELENTRLKAENGEEKTDDESL